MIIGGERLNRIEPLLDDLPRSNRSVQPAAQVSGTHGRHGAVKHRKECTLLTTVEREIDLQIASRSRVENHSIAHCLSLHGADMG